MHVDLFKLSSDCSALSSARALAVLKSWILGRRLLLLFFFHSDNSLCMPSGSFRETEVLAVFGGLGVLPPLLLPPHRRSRLRSPRGDGVWGWIRAAFGAGMKSAGRDCDVLRLLLRIDEKIEIERR